MKKYYVYLEGMVGVELIGSGTYEECLKIKEKKEQEWKPDYVWTVTISDHEKKEVVYWD